MKPEDIWPVEDEYAESYHKHADWGHQAAQRSNLCIVGIARTAMPYLANTLGLVDELVTAFAGKAFYAYENDSEDDTAEVLRRYASDRPWVTVQSETLRAPEGRGFEPDRTTRLAACRTKCQEWVAANCRDAHYTLVLDLDPHGGFSPMGILNSIGWMNDLESQTTRPSGVGGMASFSLFCHVREGGEIGIAHYDAWAMRMNWWEDRRDKPGGMKWAHMLMPPVGSPPIPMNSAFGGACLYRTNAFLSGRYSGTGVNGQPDCEHVPFHHSLRRAGWQMYLNPGSRYVAVLPAQREEPAAEREGTQREELAAPFPKTASGGGQIEPPAEAR